MIMEFILGLWFGYWVQILCLTIKILLVIQINHFINYIPDILIYKSVQFINLLENSKKRLDSVDTKIMIWLSNSYKNSIVNNKNEKIFQMTNNKVSENVQNLLSVIEKYKRKYQWKFIVWAFLRIILIVSLVLFINFSNKYPNLLMILTIKLIGDLEDYSHIYVIVCDFFDNFLLKISNILSLCHILSVKNNDKCK